jgi:signal transduction histidine kinase
MESELVYGKLGVIMGETSILTDTILEIEKGERFQVLVVEDNQSDFRLLERSLKQHDPACDLYWAATAGEALAVLEENRFDVVLLDFNLPDMTGLELFKRMTFLAFDLPVIFVTGMGNEQAAVMAFKLGAQDYIIKDVAGEYLHLLPYVIRKGHQQWEDGRARQETEKALRELTAELTKTNHKLSKAMQTKDQFLANMSHELRTPLTAIMGKTEVLLEGIYGPLSAKQSQALEVIDSSSNHLLVLINDILDVTRIEAGQIELDWETVALRSLCEASIQFIIGEAHDKSITINSQFDERIQTIQGDNRRLKQILVNLLSNAVKFTPEGGEIGLEVQGDFANEIVRIVVWDTGIGISEEGKRQLFSEMNRPKPFVQLENSLSRQYPGTGLGLVLVYSLTELHSGSLRIESQAGAGTRITVSLPLRSSKRPSRMPAESDRIEDQGEQRQSGRILLVEDNIYTVEGLVDFLSELGYEIFLANDGEQAVEKAAQLRPDLILMDIQLPKRDGLEAIKMIRTDLGLVDVPIIALTALTMQGDRERCLDAGANEFISKPFNVHQVTEVIRQLSAVRG